MNLPNQITRPQLLKWLCLGSASVGVLWIIMFLVMIIYSFEGSVPAELFPGIAMDYLQVGYWFMILEIVLTGLGVTAVYLMWQLKRKGFYLYAIIKTLIYFLPVAIIGEQHLTFLGLVITSVFIVLYGVVFTHIQKIDK